jgi:nucleoside-diphosphate-sugar epimerase
VRPKELQHNATPAEKSLAANGLLRLIPGYVPTLTPDKVRELYHHDWVCDATSMSEMTAWRPRTPIAAGFAAAIAWYRRHGWL